MSNMPDNSELVLEFVEWFAHDDLAPSVFLKSDLVPGKMTQYQFAEELRTKKIQRTAGYIYYRQKIWTRQYGVDLKPKPANVAVALCLAIRLEHRHSSSTRAFLARPGNTAERFQGIFL